MPVVQELKREGKSKNEYFIDCLYAGGGNAQPQLPRGRLEVCTLSNAVYWEGTIPG